MTIMTREISKYDDVIDSRDVIERIAELEDPDAGWSTDEDHAELQALRALAEQGQYAPDWQYGATLVRDSYFTEYAEQLAEELNLIPRDGTWPATCIDWEQAARELQMDYTHRVRRTVGRVQAADRKGLGPPPPGTSRCRIGAPVQPLGRPVAARRTVPGQRMLRSHVVGLGSVAMPEVPLLARRDRKPAAPARRSARSHQRLESQPYGSVCGVVAPPSS